MFYGASLVDICEELCEGKLARFASLPRRRHVSCEHVSCHVSCVDLRKLKVESNYDMRFATVLHRASNHRIIVNNSTLEKYLFCSFNHNFK